MKHHSSVRGTYWKISGNTFMLETEVVLMKFIIQNTHNFLFLDVEVCRKQLL